MELHTTIASEPRQNLAALYDTLLILLKKESEVYEELRASILLYRQMLKNPNVDGIVEAHGRIETIVLKAKVLDEVLTNTVRKMAIMSGHPKGASLSELSEGFDPRRREILMGYRDRLQGTLRQVDEANRDCKALLDASLASLQGSISFIGSLMNRGTTYVPSGQMTSVGRYGSILRAQG
jgi:hypothetical protein